MIFALRTTYVKQGSPYPGLSETPPLTPGETDTVTAVFQSVPTDPVAPPVVVEAAGSFAEGDATCDIPESLTPGVWLQEWRLYTAAEALRVIFPLRGYNVIVVQPSLAPDNEETT